MGRKRKRKSNAISNLKRSKLELEGDVQKNSRHIVIINELPTELLNKIFSYVTGKNCMKNLAQTCQRFNVLCTVNFTLKINFDKIANGEIPIINRDYSKVILEGTEIPEHFLDSLSSMNLETVSSLQITRSSIHNQVRSKGSKYCKILARSYLKILKMFPNIISLELDSVRLSVILKSDTIKIDELPILQNLTFLKTRDVNECVYQCLWKANNLTKIIVTKVTARRCHYFMNLLEQCRTNLKHLEADLFDVTSRKFSMDALEYLYFDFSNKHSLCGYSINFWLLDSPMLKTCSIKSFDFHANGILDNTQDYQSSILMLTIEERAREYIIEELPKLLKRFSLLEKLMCGKVLVWQK